MKRRDFLSLGAAAAAGMSVSGPSPAAAGPLPAATSPPAPGRTSPLAGDTDQAERRRLENIAHAQRHIRRCLRKHQVTDYLPGQCCYNLGEYPCRKPWEVGEWDERELDRLRAHGIGLIQLHDEWNDSLRLFGQDRYSPVNPAGFRRFLEMAHRRGMRVVVYFSSGYIDRRDPDFRREWATPRDLCEIYWQNAHCSPASPGWRAYLTRRLLGMLDQYPVDGIYNDMGYLRLVELSPEGRARDELSAFDESPTHDGAVEDLLGLIYAEVHRRGGVVKVHYGGAAAPQSSLKLYDYLWVGEGRKDGDRLRQTVKNFAPYVVPCLDMSRAAIASEDELYLHAVPYMQFPVLLAGRPFTGQRSTIPGIAYPPEETCFWTRHCRDIWRYYQAHPEGPFSFGWWDSVPGRPTARSVHQRWLRRYLPLVEEGTWAWLEVADTDLYTAPASAELVASVFVNRGFYLVLANYGPAAVEVRTADAYVAVGEASAPAKTWTIGSRELRILQRSG